MSAPTWQAVGAVDAGKFGEARRQVHNAAQWLVRLAHTYMRHEPADRQILLRWDTARQALVTQEFLPDLALELCVPTLALQFREHDRPAPHIIDLDDRTPAEVEAWVLVELLHRQLDRDRFSKALPYDMPNLMTGDAISYRSETLEPALAELAAWLGNASAVLELVGEGAPVWCWPQVLHLGVLLSVHAGKKTSKRMLRAGFSPGNDDNPEPFFYADAHDPKKLGSIKPMRVLTAAGLASSKNPATSALEFLAAEIKQLRGGK